MNDVSISRPSHTRRTGLVVGVLALASALSASNALAAPNPSSATPAFAANGTAYNNEPACKNKIEGDSGSVSGDLNGAASGGEYTITLSDTGDKTSAFSASGAVVTQAIAKASTNANIFSYGSAGVGRDTIFGTGKKPENNGLASADLRPADERNGISHVCFAVAEPSVSTAATFRSFTAKRVSGGVTLRWKTASEIGVLGYNLYRDLNGKRARLNRALITGKGLTGGSYSFKCGRAKDQAGTRYWLEAIDLDGSRICRSVRI